MVGLVVLLVAGGGLAWAIARDKQTPSNTDSGSYVNLEPTTEQEKQETEAYKRSLAEDQPSPPPTSEGKKQVTPVITNADNSSVRAYVSGIVEDGGTCTFTFSRSGFQTKTTTSEGFADATTTVCTPVSTSSLNLASGQWSVVLNYSSSKAEGKSQPKEFSV